MQQCRCLLFIPYRSLLPYPINALSQRFIVQMVEVALDSHPFRMIPIAFFGKVASMKLSLVSIERAGYVKLAAVGDITSNDLLDAGGSNPFEMVLGASWATNNILLDLGRTAFMDSSAIGWLIDSQQQGAVRWRQIRHPLRPTPRRGTDRSSKTANCFESQKRRNGRASFHHCRQRGNT